MRKELDEQLCAKYPEIFRDRRGDMRKTCMVWGFDCGDGWFNIIDAMCANIQGHIKNRLENIKLTEKWNAKVNDPEHEWTAIVERKERPVPEPVPQVVATQVKEKFGSLRFYFVGGDDYIDGIVDMATSMSYCTCEVCGAPGTSESEGWVRVRCEEHK